MPRRNFFTEVINRQADTALRGRQAEELAISNQTLAQRQIIEALYKQALAEAQQGQNAVNALPIGPEGMRNDVWTAIMEVRKGLQGQRKTGLEIEKMESEAAAPGDFAKRKQQLYASVKPRLPKGSVVDPSFFPDSAEGLQNMRDAIEADLDPGFEVHNTGDGGLYVLDKKTKSVVNVIKTTVEPQDATTDLSDIPAPEKSLFDSVDDATGIRSGWYEAWSRAPGRKSLTEKEQKVVSSRERFNIFKNYLALSLVQNPRFPVTERQAVLEAISIDPKLFDNPTALRERLSTARGTLSTMLEQSVYKANDTNLPKDYRESQREKAAILKNALAQIGEPPKAGGNAESQQLFDQADAIIGE